MKELLDSGRDRSPRNRSVLLAMHGHRGARRHVSWRDAHSEAAVIATVAREDASITSYLAKMTPEQLAVLDDPAVSRRRRSRTRAICAMMGKQIGEQ